MFSGITGQVMAKEDRLLPVTEALGHPSMRLSWLSHVLGLKHDRKPAATNSAPHSQSVLWGAFLWQDAAHSPALTASIVRTIAKNRAGG